MTNSYCPNLYYRFRYPDNGDAMYVERIARVVRVLTPNTLLMYDETRGGYRSFNVSKMVGVDSLCSIIMREGKFYIPSAYRVSTKTQFYQWQGHLWEVDTVSRECWKLD